MNGRSVLLIFIVLIGTLGIGPAWAGPTGGPALLHRVDIYRGTTWEVVQSFFEPTESGRHYMKNQEAHLSAGNCADLLQAFQARPLDAMEKDRGYVTPEMRRQFERLDQMGIKSSQVVTVNQYSELNEEEARTLFPDPVELEERTLRKSPGKKRQISRGTMWFIRGFELDPAQLEAETPAPLKPKIVPLPLLWEHKSAPLPFPLSRPVDRMKVRAVYEIGRSLSEGPQLPGDFKLMASLIAQVIAQEADVFNLDSQNVVLTSHTLRADRARLFALLFGTRLLNDSVVERMESDLSGFMTRHQDEPLPKGREWEKFENSVSYTSLAAAKERFPVEELSELAWRTAAASGGLIRGRKALEFWREFSGFFRRDLHFNHPDIGRSSRPLMVLRGSDAIFIEELMSLVDRFGVPRIDLKDERTARPVQNLLNIWQSSVDVNFAPDLFLEEWYGRTVHLHPGFEPDRNLPPRSLQAVAHLITNMDPELVNRVPRVYSAAVILGLWDMVDYEISQLSPFAFNILRYKLNEDREAKRLPGVHTVDAETFFDTYGLAVAPVDGNHAAELRQLGGKPTPGKAQVLSGNVLKSGYLDQLPNVIEFKLVDTQVTLFKFNSKEIAALKQMFPGLSNNARKALRNGYNKIKLRLYRAPMI